MKIVPYVKTWMNCRNIILNEISQPQEGIYGMISFICSIQIGQSQLKADLQLPATGGSQEREITA